MQKSDKKHANVIVCDFHISGNRVALLRMDGVFDSGR